MGVTVWQSPWQGGKQHHFTPGVYYGQQVSDAGVYNFGSMRVDDGYACVIWAHWNADTTERLHFGPVDYFENLDYVLSQRCSIQVMALDGVTKDDCAVLWDGNPWRHTRTGGYSANWILTPTASVRHAYTYFGEDRPSWAFVPADYQLTLWEHGDGKGREVTLGPGLHELRNFGMDNWASSYKLVPDSFTQAGITFHVDQAQTQDLGASRLVEFLADNRHSASPTTFTQSLSKEVSKSVSTHWSNSTSVTAGVTITVGGEAAQVKGEFSLELTNTFEVGKATENTETETIAREISKEVPAHSAAMLVLSAQYGKAVIPMTATLRNSRTGQLKAVNGTITCDVYSSASATAEDR